MSQYPTGLGIFTTDTTGMPAPVGPQINKLVGATGYSPSLSVFSSYENYVAQELPTIFLPWEQVYTGNVVLKDLSGFTADQENPFSDTFPELWHFGK